MLIKANLVCKDGHKWYSPQADLILKNKGHCGMPLGTRVAPCPLPLKRLKEVPGDQSIPQDKF